MTLFPLGGSRLISRDFVGPEVEDEEMREATRRKRQAILHAWRYLPSYLQPLRQRSRVTDASMGEDVLCEKTPSVDEKSVSSTALPLPDQALCLPPCSPAVGTHADMAPFTSRSPSPSPSLTQVGSIAQAPRPNEVRSEPPHAGSLVAPPPRPRRLHGARTFISGLLSAASLSVILGFAIALITPLKALLVALPGSPIPNAPDGAPPLAFVMDTAAFVGAASVPLGLICLGSALARLKVPRGAWRAMPLGAIGGLAVAKIVVSPVLGVLTCQGLTRAGVIDREDKVLRFVCMCVMRPLRRRSYTDPAHATADSSPACRRRRRKCTSRRCTPAQDPRSTSLRSSFHSTPS